MSSKLLNYPSATSTTSAHSRFINNSSSAVAPGAIAGSCSLNYDNLQLDDILCPVCASVLIEPVYLPCQHLFCRNCLSETIEKNKLTCPCCRKRFGTWYRNASRVNKLVHERLWQAIQSQFREHLADEGALASVEASKPSITLAKPGEIREDFSNEIKRFQKQRQEDATKELTATEQCILSLYKQEGIIDLADNSSHVSVSSTTTPDPHEAAAGCEKTANVATISPMAGPSSLCEARPQVAGRVAKDEMQKASVTIGLLASKSPSNESVISISSTSSAQSAVTASSCGSSSASERYSLLKSVVQQVGRSAEQLKQKVQGTILHRLTSGKLQQHQKTLSTMDLNKSEYCVKPTTLHKIEQRGVEEEADGSGEDAVDDTDSLKAEQNHFIPIIASLPKSSFSLDALIRVKPERTATEPDLKYNFTPKKSVYRPLKITPVRLAAFSVVNPLPLPKTPVEQTGEKACAKSKKKEKTPTSATPRRGRPRRVKVKLTPTKARKSTARNQDPTGGSAGMSYTIPRTTRRAAEMRGIKDIIISDQQRREEQIEMERRDFEFAQKLQEKLNRTSGIMQEIHRQYPAPRSTGYSLRRKARPEALNESLSSSASALNRSTPATTEEGCSKKTTVKATRKRKATSSSVENDVPFCSSPTKQKAADHSKPRPTRQTRSNKLANSSILDGATTTTAVEPQSIPQRKSTRKKTR